MDGQVDPYVILGLPSGEQGAKLSEVEIKKAYRSKLLELHPDKRPDDPNAHRDFLNLRSSYKFLMNKTARQSFHEQRISRKRKSQQKTSSKPRRKSTDVDEREQAARAAYSAANAARDMEEQIRTSNEQEIARIKRDIAASKAASVAVATSTLKKQEVKEAAASTQCPCGHCQGDWFDREFSCNFGGCADSEAYENSLLKKFRRKDINNIPKHQDL